MREPKPIEGARALLFERLMDDDPKSLKEEPHPFRILNKKELKESVRRELERLLNTRCSVPTHLLGDVERTIINYGIPDFSSFSAQNADDQRRLAQIIRETINAFEPRLRQVQVTVEPFQKSNRALWVKIDGVLLIGSVTEPVSFPVLVQHRTGGAEIHEHEST
ncbi:MAG TPA: type VI secretion system baseplate subunit TssE [Pyrinomonadaceae bacterium]|jgi:type VI secretion system protein ImpF